MFVEMKVRGLALDPVSNMPIIILRDEEDKRSLPIWVGIFEANAIALELEKIATPRPMTHDLIKNILEEIDAVLHVDDIIRVVIEARVDDIGHKVNGRTGALIRHQAAKVVSAALIPWDETNPDDKGVLRG
jgi:hypothetical protein